ncbi:MAG: sensor histidine kinase [Lachnospiraceae bacterium]|nr:sensor histidine kinase [Lachnospiraceae bacterium]
MKKLTHNLGAKIAAVIFWATMMLVSVGGAVAGYCLNRMGFYSGRIVWAFGYEYQENIVFGEMEEGMVPVHEGLYHFCWAIRYGLIFVALVAAVLAVFALIFLLCSAGHQPDRKEAEANIIDKIPLDLFVVGIALIAFALGEVAEWSFWMAGTIGDIAAMGIWIVVFSLLLLWCLMSAATRFKIGTLWKNNVIAWALEFVWKQLVGIFEGVSEICRGIPLLWKVMLLIIGISVLEILTLAHFYVSERFMTLWLLEKIVLIPFILMHVLSMKKLKAGGEKLAEGNLDYRVNTRWMMWDFKKHGENLNSISEGMHLAVEEKMKSERFKTELITNVSHDIKTPLTSIINYVDLIKKEDLQNETVNEYVDVLDRQSKRLKKLIEDLVEASKASTGNISVEMQKTAVGVVLTQAAGEYEDRMNSRNLELFLNQPQEEVFIMADGRLLWRVFDNLLSNICKYAMSGTRVYLNLERSNGKAVITFRNISAYALNLSSEELMERFTRGDQSRHTEGSGLGLSITKSLTDLQKGEMDLYTDGDLFKVVLTFDQIMTNNC